MELNQIATGIKIVGTTIKDISVKNNIVNVQKEAKRSFGLNINEPSLEKIDQGFFSQLAIDFEIEIEQSENRKFKLELSLEGAFLSDKDIVEEEFKQRVSINGAAALIGIARGKIESITSNIFDSGKVVIPFVNVIEYYKGLSQ